MRKIDFSKSLKYLGDDIISEADASRNTGSFQRKPRFTKHISIAACAALIILSALFIGTNSKLNHTRRPPDTSHQTTPQDTISSDTLPLPPTVTDEPPITSVSDIGENTAPTEPEKTNEIPHIGGSDYAFSRKYVDQVYNIYLACEIAGQEGDEWVDNVFLLKTPEEQEALPPIYQIIRDLNISKEDFIAENNKYVDYPGMHFSDDVISGLYQEDINEMKRLLASPLALYYDGEIYTFDELCQDAKLAEDIPAEILGEYLDFIYEVCKQNEIIKYMQEDINKVRSCIK